MPVLCGPNVNGAQGIQEMQSAPMSLQQHVLQNRNLISPTNTGGKDEQSVHESFVFANIKEHAKTIMQTLDSKD
eukprot:340590-Ditylum_brightwellii.AAC.1